MKYLVAYAWKREGANTGKFGIDLTDDPIMWRQEMMAANPEVFLLSTASPLTKEESDKYDPLFKKMSKKGLSAINSTFMGLLKRARILK